LPCLTLVPSPYSCGLCVFVASVERFVEHPRRRRAGWDSRPLDASGQAERIKRWARALLATAYVPASSMEIQRLLEEAALCREHPSGRSPARIQPATLVSGWLGILPGSRVSAAH
jgi:hypothetical protein